MTATESEPNDAKAPGWGPISRYVAANILRLREARGLSTTRLAAALKEIGQPIPATGITRIEKGERRVDVDDLIALSVVLRVSPAALLLPPTVFGEIDVVRSKTVLALDAWQWINGGRPLELPKGEEERTEAFDDHQLYSLPPPLRKWRQRPDGTLTAASGPEGDE